MQEAVERIQSGRTSVTVAHRLSTIQNANRIFVMEFGKVVESGRHEELLAREGPYYQLYSKSVKQ